MGIETKGAKPTGGHPYPPPNSKFDAPFASHLHTAPYSHFILNLRIA